MSILQRPLWLALPVRRVFRNFHVQGPNFHIRMGQPGNPGHPHMNRWVCLFLRAQLPGGLQESKENHSGGSQKQRDAQMPNPSVEQCCSGAFVAETYATPPTEAYFNLASTFETKGLNHFYTHTHAHSSFNLFFSCFCFCFVHFEVHYWVKKGTPNVVVLTPMTHAGGKHIGCGWQEGGHEQCCLVWVVIVSLCKQLPFSQEAA